MNIPNFFKEMRASKKKKEIKTCAGILLLNTRLLNEIGGGGSLEHKGTKMECFILTWKRLNLLPENKSLPFFSSNDMKEKTLAINSSFVNALNNSRSSCL